MSEARDKYIMEDAREAARLRRKVDPAAWVDRYLKGLLPACQRVLDVGCGPGALAAAAAQTSGSLVVEGVDQSEQRICSGEVALPHNVRLQQGNATALPFESSRFDLVYSRFMLEYLAERQIAVNEMARVCRPGGRVLLQDLDGQLVWHYPEDLDLQRDVEAVLACMAKTGFDPFVGRKLYSLARHAGLLDLQVVAESYHLFAGRIDEANYALWELKLDIAMPLAARALGSGDRAKDLKKRFMAYLQSEETLTYSVVFTVVGTKRA